MACHFSFFFSVERSLFKLKLDQDDIENGVSIDISMNKPETDMKFIHYIASAKNLLKKRALTRKDSHLRKKRYNLIHKHGKSASKFRRSLAAQKEDETKNAIKKAMDRNTNRVVMRNKRSAPLKEIGGQKELQIEDLRQFDEDVDSGETNDYNSNENGKQQQIKRSTPNTKFMKHHQNYAFDTTDSDHFNDDDDLLQQYYGHAAVKRSPYDNHRSFTDIMRVSAIETEHDNQFMKQLHYGDSDSFLNDGAEDDNTENTDDIYDQYDNYDDDDY